MFQHMKLGTKLFLLVGFGVVALGSVGIVSTLSFNSLKGDWTAFIEVVQVKQKHLLDIRSEMGYGGAIHRFKNYVIRGQQKHFHKYMEKAEKINASIVAYRSAGFISSIEDNSLKKVNAMVETYREASIKARQLLEKGKSVKAIDKAIKINDKPYLDALSALSKELDNATTATTEGLNSQIGKITNFLVISTLVSLVVFIISGVFITRSITRPIQKIIEELSSGASEVKSAAGQISDSSQSLAEGATEQAASLEETSASLEEIYRKSTRLNSSHTDISRMPSSA